MPKTKLKRTMIAATVFTAATLGLAQEFDISRYTIDGGGILYSEGGGFELSSTIGQPDAGTLSNGTFTLTGGFWFPLMPGDANEDGGITLLDYSEFTGCMSGEGGGLDPACGLFDSDGDEDVDLRDFRAFQLAFSAS
jgi:hypothetical protein